VSNLIFGQVFHSVIQLMLKLFLRNSKKREMFNAYWWCFCTSYWIEPWPIKLFTIYTKGIHIADKIKKKNEFNKPLLDQVHLYYVLFQARYSWDRIEWSLSRLIFVLLCIFGNSERRQTSSYPALTVHCPLLELKQGLLNWFRKRCHQIYEKIIEYIIKELSLLIMVIKK